MEGDIDPEYVDKVDPANLIRIYGLFGLLGREKTHNVRMSQLEREIDSDPSGAVYHLWNEGMLRHKPERDSVSLKSSERALARNLSKELYRGGKTPADEVADLDWIPDYLSDPNVEENFNAPEDLPAGAPMTEEFYTRVIEVMDDGEPLRTHEVEDKLSQELNFDLEPQLKYMEQQGVVQREKGGYKLLTENIDDRFFGEEMSKSSLKQEDRYRDNPWK